MGIKKVQKSSAAADKVQNDPAAAGQNANFFQSLINKKMKYKSGIVIILALAMFVLGAKFAWAGQAKLSWNANSESDLNGYRIYYGTSPRTGNDPKTCTLCGYATKVDVGKVTTYTIINLTNNQTYYFSVTAYDASNNESSFSAQVNKLVSTTCDFNSDSRVNSVDFGIMMSNWNSTSRPASDVNQDGLVNSVDFGVLMSQWTG